MKHVPRAQQVVEELAMWVPPISLFRHVNYLEQGQYGVHTWALFENGTQVGLIRLRTGDSIAYSGVGKEIVECL